MLYLVSGNDFVKRKAKLSSLIDYVISKKPDATIRRLTPSGTVEKTITTLEELTLSQGLFEQKVIVVLEDFLPDEELRDGVISRLKELKDSENIFIIYEGALPERVSKKVTPFAVKAQVFTDEKVSLVRPFNIFNLADALGRRDKKGVWVELLKAFKEGSLPEEVHGTLFWQIKSILAVKEGGSDANALGMKPFTYSKAKTFSKNYSLEELKQLSHSLVMLYHDSHRGMDSLDTGLERLLLKNI